MYGFKITELDGEVCLYLDKGMGTNYISMFEMFSAWKEQTDKLSAGEISKDDYDRWRYYYPKYDTTQLWEKVPSQESSNTLVEHFEHKL